MTRSSSAPHATPPSRLAPKGLALAFLIVTAGIAARVVIAIAARKQAANDHLVPLLLRQSRVLPRVLVRNGDSRSLLRFLVYLKQRLLDCFQLGFVRKKLLPQVRAADRLCRKPCAHKLACKRKIVQQTQLLEPLDGFVNLYLAVLAGVQMPLNFAHRPRPAAKITQRGIHRRSSGIGGLFRF